MDESLYPAAQPPPPPPCQLCAPPTPIEYVLLPPSLKTSLLPQVPQEAVNGIFQLPPAIEVPELPSEPRFPAPPLPPGAESNSLRKYKVVEY